MTTNMTSEIQVIDTDLAPTRLSAASWSIIDEFLTIPDILRNKTVCRAWFQRVTGCRLVQVIDALQGITGVNEEEEDADGYRYFLGDQEIPRIWRM